MKKANLNNDALALSHSDTLRLFGLPLVMDFFCKKLKIYMPNYKIDLLVYRNTSQEWLNKERKHLESIKQCQLTTSK